MIIMIVDDHGNENQVDDYDHDGVNAIGWQSYNNVDNHDDDDPYTK